MSNRQVAGALYVAETTVKRHLVNIFARMGVHARGEATREALRRRWISVGEILKEEEA